MAWLGIEQVDHTAEARSEHEHETGVGEPRLTVDRPLDRAGRLSDAMTLAANQVKELAEAARREQDRREQAREWKRKQDDEGLLDKAGDFLFGEDDKPPIPPPEPPPRFVSPPPSTQGRE